MSLLFPLLLTSFLIFSSSLESETTTSQEDATTEDADTVMLVILARSRAHILPHWLGLVEQLNYPKSAISVYIHTDHNQDDTPVLLSEWAEAVGELYKDVTVNTSSKIAYTQSLGPSNWEEDRHVHIMKVRQAALDHGRAAGVKYLFVVDTDNFLTNPETLNILISRKKNIVAPMLTITDAVAYSNYWAGMTPAGYYQSAPEYFDILNRRTLGVHQVPMVHSTLLFDLQDPKSSKLHYWPLADDYTGPVDDIIYLALTAASAEIGMWVDNTEEFGWMLPRGEYNTVGEEVAAYQEYFADHLSLKSNIPRSSHLKKGVSEEL